MADSTSTLVAVTTPITDAALELLSLHGEESLSQPFRYEVTLRSKAMSVDFSTVLGKPITVTLTAPDNTKQYVRGVVVELSQDADFGTTDTLYHAVLRPTFWLLSLRSDYKIFQKKSITDIIEEAFSNAGFTDFKNSCTKTYSALDFVVQYGETTMDFVSRLMERAGIFYYFEHTASSVKLVMGDDASAYGTPPGTATIPYAMRPSSSSEAVLSGAVEQKLVPTSYKVNDYNFTTPKASLLSTSGGQTYQLHEYPGKYAGKGDGDTLAGVRLGEQESEQKTFRGRSHASNLHAGYKFTMSGHPRTDANMAWVLRTMRMHVEGGEYRNEFLAIPATVTFHPPRVTPRPTIKGTQTALVTGKAGEEIWTDKYGRVTLRFHWDASGTSDETSSCFVRVAQVWAGKTWGGLFTPRIGQEVVVAFVDGDPEQPMVIGSVYNADQTMPYTLPDDQTKSTIKTNSSKGGQGFNELRFEDKAGSEEVFLQAQKDLNLNVVKGNYTTTIATGNETHSTKGTRAVTVEGNEMHTNKANFQQDITGTTAITSEGNETRTNKANFEQDVTGNYTLKVSGNLTIKATGSVTIESGTGFTAKGGTTMAVSGGTSAEVKAGTQLSLSGGATAELKGSAQTAIKGGIVQIN